MKTKFLFLNLCLISCILASCKNSAKQNQMTNIKTHEKRTQAFLLTQDFDFDLNNKDLIKGEYVSRKKLEVPSDLVPQNKWFMFEGPVLENDLVAFRFYADSRHRFDIFGKTVSDLVMDTVSWDYHDIENWGSDILKVGNSLGIGSPAIWYQDSLYTLSNCDKKVIEIIESGDKESVIRTSFTNLTVEGKSFDLIQDWSIQPGLPWSKMSLKTVGDDLPKDMKFATGIVKHLPQISQREVNGNFFAFNWGKQSFHNENLGMAIIADNSYKPVLIEDKLSHAFVFDNAQNELSYRLVSVWERDNNNIRSAEAFEKFLSLSLSTN